MSVEWIIPVIIVSDISVWLILQLSMQIDQDARKTEII